MKVNQCFTQFPAFVVCGCAVTLASLCGGLPAAHAVMALRPAQADLTTQQFFCSAGYDRYKCAQHVGHLKTLLVRFPESGLRQWSWVIVRTEDWQPFLRRLGVDRRTPAFSALEERESYLEESLFLSPSSIPASGRAAELEQTFHVSLDQLLSIAVRHELGHALCHDEHEDTANRVAEQLRAGKRPACTETIKSIGPIEEMYLQSPNSGFARP